MTKYRAAFERWRLEFLAEEFARANRSVSRMATATGVNRQHLYVLLERTGINVRGRNRPKNYRQAFEDWRRQFLVDEFASAGRSATRMSEATGLNRSSVYKLCWKAGVPIRGMRVRCLPRKTGNAAWHALRNQASA